MCIESEDDENVSIRAPVRGATCAGAGGLTGAAFRSAPPCGERRGRPRQYADTDLVSIRPRPKRQTKHKEKPRLREPFS